MSIHFTSLKGLRDANEDKHNITLGLSKPCANCAPVNFYGIYDGHGGKFVSNFLSEKFHSFFTDVNTKYPLDTKYVKNVFTGLQNILCSKYKDKSTECGSTCLALCHYKIGGSQYINVINAGDSRAVICRNNIAIPLTKDHKPNWPDEKCRISKLGGQIKFDNHDWRINDLSVSRAFGDISSEKYVIPIPDLYKYKLRQHDKFIIMGCDGLWDVCSPQDAVNFVLENCYDINMQRINKNMNIARKLAEHALNLDTSDNITIIVIFID